MGDRGIVLGVIYRAVDIESRGGHMRPDHVGSVTSMVCSPDRDLMVNVNRMRKLAPTSGGFTRPRRTDTRIGFRGSFPSPRDLLSLRRLDRSRSPLGASGARVAARRAEGTLVARQGGEATGQASA